MDIDVLNNKLESLTRCVHRIESRFPKKLGDFRNFAGYITNATFGERE